VPDEPPPRRSPSERRRPNPGRRESDRLYDAICDQLADLRDGFKSALADLRDLIRNDVMRLDEDVDKLEDAVEKAENRLTDVEIEQIKARERTVTLKEVQVAANERRSKWSLRIGIAAGLAGIAAFLIEHVNT
jgi:hypothetical protein